MFKVKIKSNLKAEVLNRLKKTVDEKFVADMNDQVVGEIMRLIKSGVSPVNSVEGTKRFKQYKDRNKYPANKKAKTPVSLLLTGEMLSWYGVGKKSGTTISVGIHSDAPSEVKERAIANNEGTVNSEGQVAIAARRFIPLKGETFNISVLRKFKNLYALRIKDLISKK